MPTPIIVFEEGNPPYNGYFDYQINTICISTNTNNIYDTLVHEYTHFIQLYRDGISGLEYQSGFDWHSLSQKYVYDKAIDIYFSVNKFEREALYNQQKYAKSDCANYWINHLLTNNKDFK